MTQIGDSRIDLLDRAGEAARDRQSADEQVRTLIEEITKDRAKAAELAKVEIKNLDPATKTQLAQMLAQQLRGQIPAQLAKALASGNPSLDVLEQLANRLANSASQDPSARQGKAGSSEAARQMATDKSVPQQALRWTQFVQKAQHVPGAQTQQRSGASGPKGEGTAFMELLGSVITGRGPGLRSPQLVARSMSDLSPTQRAVLMQATFGDALALQLQELGVDDPLLFVRAGSLPDGRADLAKALGIPRARLLGLLMRAELLKIGGGRNGEMGIRPDLLGPLRHAGIAMLGTMASLRGLSREELAHIYELLRQAAGGFARAVKGARPPLKRDLLHWARAATRQRSEIMLADVERREGHLDSSDAQELIQAWYMENLLWERLAQARRRQEELDQSFKRVQREERERQQRDRDQRDQQQEEDVPDWIDDPYPYLEYDTERGDNLMCFWITDFNADLSNPGGIRRMYVCIDPDSGAIIPQAIDQSLPT